MVMCKIGEECSNGGVAVNGMEWNGMEFERAIKRFFFLQWCCDTRGVSYLVGLNEKKS